MMIKGIDEEDCIIEMMEVANQADTQEMEEEFWNKQSIYRLPSFIKEGNENFYEPLLVSIGPYHHGKDHLKPMEVHKRRALRHFINRSHVALDVYMDALQQVEKELKESYEQLDVGQWGDTDTFLELMIVDGCFILEFMDIASGSPKDYPPNDPIFSYYGCFINYDYVMRDILLLENQLPYRVLETLVFIAELKHGVSLESARAMLSQMLMFTPDTSPGRHLLDMFMNQLLKKQSSSEAEFKVYSASQLDQAGIQFNKIYNFDISFDSSKGILNLPSIYINHYTISTFKNLKAFELRGSTGREFNSYIRLMETLIASIKDVNLLKSKGIIVNLLWSDEDIVKLFKELARDTVVDMNYKSCIARKDMNECYDKRMKQLKNKVKGRVIEWLSSLHQNYFSNPWTSISVLVAACFLGLTVIQTIYTVRGGGKQ